MLVVGTFLTRQRATMEIRNHHMGVQVQLGLKGNN